MGGEGSGRRPDPMKTFFPARTNIVNTTESLEIPNYSGLQAVKKTDPTISASGHTIQDEGTDRTARTYLNFSGAGVSAVDDSGNDATVVNIAGGAGDNLGNHIATQTISGAAIYATGALTGGGSGHDQFSDFVAAEHVDWAGASAGTIHASNYVDNNTTYVSSDFDHDALTNFVAAEHVNWATSGAGTVHASNYVDNDTTYVSSDFDHDQLTNFASNEHFTEASISHHKILNSGANTHAAIDTHIADTSDPHGATITQTNATITNLSGASIVRTGDVSTSGAAYVPNVLYGTGGTPPTASGFPIGSVYIQYTA